MTQNQIRIFKLDRLPASELRPLVEESRAQGFEFVARLAEEYADGTNAFNQYGEALFGVYAGERLVAIRGLNRDPYLPGTETGRVRHVYVLSAWRRQGLGKLLVERIITEARPHFRLLTPRTFSAPADAFYRALGFQPSQDIRHASHILVLAE